MNIVHKPVLKSEILEFLFQFFEKEHKLIFADVTTGQGGHSEFLLENFPKSQAILLDRDKQTLKTVEKRLKNYEDRILGIYHSNFSNFDFCKKPNFILVDLGISSYHYQISQRGFGFQKDESLDMRLEPENQAISAKEILHSYSKERLFQIFYEYGEESWSKKIVEQIIQIRKKETIDTTAKLADIICKTIPKKFWKKGFHPATKIFQALRIEVNQELEHIKNGIPHLFENLAEDGILLVISFHSLEDRIVKMQFKEFAQNYHLITKKPIQANSEEKQENKSSRSAKLRIIRKTKKEIKKKKFKNL